MLRLVHTGSQTTARYEMAQLLSKADFKGPAKLATVGLVQFRPQSELNQFISRA